MSIATQPLRDEHADLFPHVESIRIVADAIGERPPVEVAANQPRPRRGSPAVRRPQRVETKLAAQQLTSNEVQELRMALYGLYVLVKLHFYKEEAAYLPLLDQKLTPEAARRMFEAMEAAAARAKKATPA